MEGNSVLVSRLLWQVAETLSVTVLWPIWFLPGTVKTEKDCGADGNEESPCG